MARNPHRRRAAITLVALSLTTALGVAVGSYLALFSRHLALGVNQLHRDKLHELARVGLEEALWALNEADWTKAGPASSTAWVTSGTSRAATLAYADLGHGATGALELTVENFAATGPVWPTITSAASVILAGGRTLRHTLRATTTPAPLFGHAVASAEGAVTFLAAGTVDSWNSDPDNNPATPAVDYAFTAGDPANHAAVVAGRTNGTHGVVLTQATVRGYVATFGLPVSYSISAAPPGRVLGPATPVGVNVDTRRIGRSAFVPVAPVFTITEPPTSGPAYGGLVGNILALVTSLGSAPPETEVYQTSGDLTILGIPLVSPSLVVDRHLKLIVNGNLTISGAGQITINPGASLQLFIRGDCTLGGGGIDNRNVDPATCVLLCTSPSTADTLEYTTAADFRGVIYCENKPIDIRQNATFHGALLSRRGVSFTTGATAPVIHYDLALRTRRFAHVGTPYLLDRITQP